VQPANASVEPVLVHGYDQRGTRMFRRIAAASVRGVSLRETPAVVEKVSYWHGAMHTLQRFTGMGYLGAAQLTASKPTPELADGHSAGLTDPAARLWAERASRRRI
jgi:hypothetical protein